MTTTFEDIFEEHKAVPEDNNRDNELIAAIPANDNLPTIPADPAALAPFIAVNTKAVEAAKALLRQPNLSKETYRALFDKTRQQAELVLTAELRLADIIKALPTKPGKRTDLQPDNPEGNRSKKEVIADLGLTPKQATNISKLTEQAVEQAIQAANDNREIPTRALALSMKQKQVHEENNAPLESWWNGAVYSIHSTPRIPTNKKTYYTVLFACAGTGEAYLKENKFISAVACEIIPERAKLYQALYPSTEMCGDITDEKEFARMVKLHKEKGCELVLASPPCQDYSLAGARTLSSRRALLFKDTIEFIRQTKPNWVMIENVPQFLTAKLPDGTIAGKYTVQELEKLGYSVNVDIVNSADYGTAQNRERAVILAAKNELWKFPKKDHRRIMLWEAIGNLPSLEAGEDSGIPYHKAPPMSAPQVEIIKHTPSGKSAHDNPAPYKPCNVDGSPSNAQFKSSFQRKNWSTPCNTITTDSASISGHRSLHPGRPLSDGTYSDARALTVLELLRCTGLPDNYHFPKDTSERLIREVLGECFAPKLVQRLLAGIPPEDDEYVPFSDVPNYKEFVPF